MNSSIVKLKNILISACCVLIVFASNFLIPSLTNGFPEGGINTSISKVWENENATALFSARYEYSEFRRRPFVLESQKVLKEKFNLPYQFSFNLINYSCLFFIFLLLPMLASKIQKKDINEDYIAVLFLVSMPIIFAFYGSMFTYDDFVQYLFLVLFLFFLFSKKHILAILFLSLACIARETSFVFYFVVLGFLLIEEYNNRLLLKLVIWTIPVLLYLSFVEWHVPKELLIESKNYLLETRFLHWENNFLLFNKFRESTTILLIMSGVYVFLLIKKLKKNFL